MKEMTPKERFKKTVNFEEPDRVPIIFGGLISSIVPVTGKYGYSALCDYLDIHDYETPWGDYGTMNADERLYQRLHSDARFVVMGLPARELISAGPLVVRDKMWGWVMKYIWDFHAKPGDVPYATWPDDLAPMRHMTELKDIDSYPYWPDPDDPVYYYPEARDLAKKLHDENHYIVYGEPHYGGTVDFTYMWLRGLDNWLMDPYLRPDYFQKLMEKITELSIEITSRWLKLVGEYLDVLVFCADLGTQNKPMISADHYEKWLLPNHKLWISEIKKLTKAKVQLHSCGSIYELLPGMIEAGFDIINPIQPLAKNMDPGKIKKDFAGQFVMHGGGDLQKMLPYGNRDDVENGIKELMQKAAPGGGYMFAFANNIPPDAPPENIVTAYDAAVKYGRYPNRS